jgi:hypothetical protein
MSLVAQTTRALIKRTIYPTTITRHAVTSSSGTSTTSSAAAKAIRENVTWPVRHLREQTPWIERFVTPPKRNITAGEYAFVEGTKRVALTIGGVAYASGFVWVMFYSPRSTPRIAEMMKTMSPEDAREFWKKEMDERDRSILAWKMY